MTTQFKLPQKKTMKKYSFQSIQGICLATSDTDTTSPLTLTTTHIFKK